jgi:hypothetical protein
VFDAMTWLGCRPILPKWRFSGVIWRDYWEFQSPQYRLTYTLLDGVMSGQFELKMPGKSDFTSYLEWSGKQR